jgi:hypothetical protein
MELGQELSRWSLFSLPCAFGSSKILCTFSAGITVRLCLGRSSQSSDMKTNGSLNFWRPRSTIVSEPMRYWPCAFRPSNERPSFCQHSGTFLIGTKIFSDHVVGQKKTARVHLFIWRAGRPSGGPTRTGPRSPDVTSARPDPGLVPVRRWPPESEYGHAN